MANLVDEGKKFLLHCMIHGHDPSYHVRLAKAFTGGPTDFTDACVLTNITEADFAGYAGQTMANFADPTINGSGEAESDSTVYTFTRSTTGTAQTIIGIYLEGTESDGTTHRLVFGHKFAASITVVNAGEEVKKLLSLFADNFTP